MWLALWLRECTVAGRFGCGPSAPTSGAVPTAGAVVSRDIRRLRQAQRLRRGYSSTDTARVHNLAPVIAHVTRVGLSAGCRALIVAHSHHRPCGFCVFVVKYRKQARDSCRVFGTPASVLVAVPRLCVVAGD
jgi:hypothetical protein